MLAVLFVLALYIYNTMLFAVRQTIMHLQVTRRVRGRIIDASTNSKAKLLHRTFKSASYLVRITDEDK